MKGPCEFDGLPSIAGHHNTGRDDKGKYLDPEFTTRTCHDHHYFLHDDLYTLGLDDEHNEVAMTFLDRVELRLRRAAVVFARLAEVTGLGSLAGVMAVVFTRWADELATFRRHLDARDPKWRKDMGFYPGEA
jgi:hypothetical protein